MRRLRTGIKPQEKPQESSVYDVVYQTHCVIVAHCAFCGEGLTESGVNDFGSLCESCYMKEYYGEEE